MKYLQYIGLILVGLFAFSCARESSIAVKADFDINVVNNDYSVPVKVQISNKTEGADAYEWTFEGAVNTHSSEKNPTITYATPGRYTIKLRAYNKDGEQDIKSIEIQIDAAMKPQFSWTMEGSDIAPVTLQMQDESLGAVDYHWEFQNGNPSTSTEKNPRVVFTQAGTHLIKLTISNGRETYSTEKTIEVKPAMNVDFDWSVDFIDQDYQAPVKLYLRNQTTNATSYEWSINGANPSTSTEENPTLVFANAGTYTIILKATNDKESKTLQKQITIHPDQNLISFNDIKLGISSAQSSIGSFFSSQLGRVLKKDDINAQNGAKIDFGYFGLDDDFTYNQIISPSEARNTAFSAIPNAIQTKVINSQELVGAQLNANQFDAIQNGRGLSSLNISDTNRGKTPFNKNTTPRIVLFQTSEGRKGAIKIKGFISSGVNSYILVDIKVQKKA